jgi:hypothetical protein
MKKGQISLDAIKGVTIAMFVALASMTYTNLLSEQANDILTFKSTTTACDDLANIIEQVYLSENYADVQYETIYDFQIEQAIIYHNNTGSKNYCFIPSKSIKAKKHLPKGAYLIKKIGDSVEIT